MNFDTIIIHYAEIGIKGKNRVSFEKLLIDNIKIKTKGLIRLCVRDSGHVTVHLDDNPDISSLKDILAKIPGIAFFSLAKKCNHDIDAIKQCAVSLLKDAKFDSFKIDARRHNKDFKLNSVQLNNLLGEAVLAAYDKKVKMIDPDMILKVEISTKYAYLSSGNIKGIGGLPTNPRQKVVALISGGFDSPVAAYMMMKRGCEVIFVHFSNKNQLTDSVKDKIIRLVEQLSKYQIKTLLYLVPFENIQKEIIMKVRSELRMLVYRRFMLKIASRIAEQHKARFLVVGDSLSQVASQTIENLEATYHGSDKQIFSPLIGMDKEETIAIAKQIGTYEASALPYGDCCSYFLPKHPMLRVDVGLLEQIEAEFDVAKLVDAAVNCAQAETCK